MSRSLLAHCPSKPGYDPADGLTQRAMQIEQNMLMHNLDVRHNTAAKKFNTIITDRSPGIMAAEQLTVHKVRDWVLSTLAADVEWEEEDSQPLFDCVGVAGLLKLLSNVSGATTCSFSSSCCCR